MLNGSHIVGYIKSFNDKATYAPNRQIAITPILDLSVCIQERTTKLSGRKP